MTTQLSNRLYSVWTKHQLIAEYQHRGLDHYGDPEAMLRVTIQSILEMDDEEQALHVSVLQQNLAAVERVATCNDKAPWLMKRRSQC